MSTVFPEDYIVHKTIHRQGSLLKEDSNNPHGSHDHNHHKEVKLLLCRIVGKSRNKYIWVHLIRPFQTFQPFQNVKKIHLIHAIPTIPEWSKGFPNILLLIVKCLERKLSQVIWFTFPNLLRSYENLKFQIIRATPHGRCNLFKTTFAPPQMVVQKYSVVTAFFTWIR